MGAVLEMTLRRTALALAALTTLLSACGEGQAVNPITTAAGIIKTVTTPAPPPLDIRASFTPELLATIGQPLLAAEMPARKANATMVLVGENAGHRTWVAADGIMLITRDGVLTGTRGFGRDLMVSNVSAVLPALRAGQGTVPREMSRIDDEGHVTPIRYNCVISRGGPQQVDLISRQVATHLVSETCTDAAAATEGFTNRYWLDGSGRIRQSDQWVGPRYGHVLMYQLVD
jgi:hypothetical protein